jgi:hypothetical protein
MIFDLSTDLTILCPSPDLNRELSRNNVRGTDRAFTVRHPKNAANSASELNKDGVLAGVYGSFVAYARNG